MDTSLIPEKFYYTIGDVSQMTKIKPHILRYWESQFKLLRPPRRYSGHRKYTQREIDMIHRIRYLVLDRKFTLSGAKREITRQMSLKPKTLQKLSQGGASAPTISIIRDVKKDVEDCLKILRPRAQQADLLEIK